MIGYGLFENSVRVLQSFSNFIFSDSLFDVNLFSCFSCVSVCFFYMFCIWLFILVVVIKDHTSWDCNMNAWPGTDTSIMSWMFTRLSTYSLMWYPCWLHISISSPLWMQKVPVQMRGCRSMLQYCFFKTSKTIKYWHFLFDEIMID